ncbi:hypothetical protein KR032_008178, partial [Drosophila birchii]
MVTRREDSQLKNLEGAVNKLRRTARGNLLLEVAKGSTESAESMRDSIARVLGEEAEVRALTEDSKVAVFEVRNLDAITTEREICEAFAKQYQLSKGAVKVRSLLPGYGESKTAVISLLCSMVRKRGEIRILWTRCRVREREGPPRCFRAADGFVRAEVAGYWIYSCYLAPSLTTGAYCMILDDLTCDMRGRSRVIVGGDFNAWEEEWGSSSTNARERAVLGAFASTDVVMLNDGVRHTFVRAGAALFIDLTLVSTAISQYAKWGIID